MSAISWNSRYLPSTELVAREIEGEVVIIPLTGGLSEHEDDLFTLNATGRAIWQLFDGNRTLRQVVEVLADTYDAPVPVIEEGVQGFVDELSRRRLITMVE